MHHARARATGGAPAHAAPENARAAGKPALAPPQPALKGVAPPPRKPLAVVGGAGGAQPTRLAPAAAAVAARPPSATGGAATYAAVAAAGPGFAGVARGGGGLLSPVSRGGAGVPAGATAAARLGAAPVTEGGMSEARAYGLPDLAAAVAAACGLTQQAQFGPGYEALLRREWGMKKGAVNSKDHDAQAKAIITDLKTALRDALERLAGGVAAAAACEAEMVGAFAEASTLGAALAEAQRACADAEARGAGLSAELDAYKAALEMSKANEAAADGELTAAGEEAGRLGEALQEARSDAERLAGELAEERAVSQGLRDDLEEQTAALRMGDKAAAADRDRLAVLLDGERARARELAVEGSSALEAAEARARTVGAALAVADAEVARLRAALEEEQAVAGRMRRERDDAAHEATLLRSQMENTQRMKESAEASISTTLASLQGTVAAFAEREIAAQNRLTALQERLAGMAGEREEGVTREAEMRRAAEAAAAREAKLRAELDAATESLAETRGAVAAAREEGSRMAAALAAARSDAGRLAGELASTREEAESRSGELTGRLMDAEGQRDAAREAVAGWEVKGAAAAAREAELVAALGGAQDALAEVQREAATLREAAGSSESGRLDKLSSLSRELEGAKRGVRDVATLRSRLTAAEDAASRMREELFAGEMARRGLHNALQELRGNIRVYVRVRPFLPGDAAAAAAAVAAGELPPEELTLGDGGGAGRPAVVCAPDGSSLEIAAPAGRPGGKDALPGAAARRDAAKPTRFAFDSVFGPRAGQEDVFGEVSHLVQSALDGYAVCLFSYGQTGSGKTWTMQGGESPGQAGLIPRSVAHILGGAARLAGTGGWSFRLEATFLEIYNEAVRDLLRPPPPPGGGGAGAAARAAEPASLTIVSAGGGGSGSGGSGADGEPPTGVDVPGLTRVPIECEADVAAVLARAAKRRAVAATSMNEVSSRSHSVFTLHIAGSHAGKGVGVAGSLSMVDLAGSERLDRSKAEGDRKREAAAINKSLSCLADVFTALARKAPHVPFRNSKLTHLLSPCFRRDGKTLMLVNLSPTGASAFESLCSLRFAATVAQVELGQARKRVAALPPPLPLPDAGAGERAAAAAAAAPAGRVAPVEGGDDDEGVAVEGEGENEEAGEGEGDGDGSGAADNASDGDKEEEDEEDAHESATELQPLGVAAAPAPAPAPPSRLAGVKRPLEVAAVVRGAPAGSRFGGALHAAAGAGAPRRPGVAPSAGRLVAPGVAASAVKAPPPPRGAPSGSASAPSSAAKKPRVGAVAAVAAGGFAGLMRR